MDVKVTFPEFHQGAMDIGYHESIEACWECYEPDGGSLTLDEIDEDACALWGIFRQWCGKNFDSVKEFFHALGRSRNTFVNGLRERGWTHGQEERLFNVMDRDGNGIGKDDLTFLEVERKKFKTHEEIRAIGTTFLRAREKKFASEQRALNEFRAKLRKGKNKNTRTKSGFGV